MEPLARPVDFHPQDWIIVVEALAQWAGRPEMVRGRRERAYELIDSIAAEQGLPPSELLFQIDSSTPLVKSFGPHNSSSEIRWMKRQI